MTLLEFEVLDVVPEVHAAAPTMLFKLRVTESTGEQIHAMALRAQIRIEPGKRSYVEAEAQGVEDLFGTTDRWSTTLTPFLWTHASTMLKGFTGELEFDLPVPCTYDFEVSGTKYLHALRDGAVPLVLLFSGTVFSRGATGFVVEQVPWHLEASHTMPISAWRAMMDAYYPNSGWVRVERETLDRLIRFKSSRGLISWEQTFDALIAGSEERV